MRTLQVALAAIALTSACASPVRMALAPGPHAGCRAAPPEAAPAAVTWIRPDDDAERRALDERCAQVGRPLIVAPATSAATPVRRLRVATWNMHDGRGDVLALVHALRQGAQDAPAPDAIVVLLQEVVRSMTRAAGTSAPDLGPHAVATGVQDIPPLLQHLGWHLAYVPGKRNRLEPAGAAAADRGIAILSSLPLSDLEAIELPIERQRRVALSGVIGGLTADGLSWHLRVVSVHLENRSGARRFWARAGASRTRQTEALLDALSLSQTESRPTPLPMLVGGDFNTWLGQREGTLRLLRDRFEPWPSEDIRPTIDVRRWRLDYLFPRLPRAVRSSHRRLDSSFGSDHYPIVAEIDFGAN